MKDKGEIINFILRATALAMGVAVTVLATLGELEGNAGFTIMGIGLFCLAVSTLPKK